MCGGKARERERKARQRAEGRMYDLQRQADADRQAEADRLQAFQQQAAQQQQQALQAIAEASKQPFKVKTAEEATTPLMRTKQKSASATKGVASLRINRTPGTNIGMGTGGTNIG